MVTGVSFQGVERLKPRGPPVHSAILSETGGFYLFAAARGAELSITLSSVVSDSTMTIVFTAGEWRATAGAPPAAACLSFTDTAGKLCISFCDSGMDGRWRIGRFDTVGKGPDPLMEFSLFRGRVLSNFESPLFDLPLEAFLEEPSLFNGIGPKTRELLITRLKLERTTPARILFTNTPEVGMRLIAECHSVSLSFLVALRTAGSLLSSLTHLLNDNSWWPELPPPEITCTPVPHDSSEDVSKSPQPLSSAVPLFTENLRCFLVLLAAIVKRQLLEREEAKQLKTLALRGEELVFHALQAYQADIDKDIEEFADTLRCILEI